MRKVLFWFLAVMITVLAIIYQRKTGPTYPQNHNVELQGKTYEIELLTSHSSSSDAELQVYIPDDQIHGALRYKRYPSSEQWDSIKLKRNADTLSATLPAQPPAGKLAYQLLFEQEGQQQLIPADKPAIIRFKGDVPAYFLMPHIFFMFTSMIFANAAGIFAAFGQKPYRLYATITLLLLTLGGMLLGPAVQYHAFNEAWAGVPLGWDLTDNKTLIAFIFWLIAFMSNRKKERPGWVVTAALVNLLIFAIPHSMFGSELDYESGEITQGFILLTGIF